MPKLAAAKARVAPKRAKKAPAIGRRSRIGVRRRIAKKKSSGPKHLLSTVSPALVPSLAYQGEAFPYTGTIRDELLLPTTDRAMVFVSNVGTSATIMLKLQWNNSDPNATTAIATKLPFTIPTLAANDNEGGPTSMRAMKASLTTVCRTTLLNRGGLVYSLNTSQRLRVPALTSTLTVVQANTVFNAVVGHPHAHALDVADFAAPRHMYCHVVDDPAYNDFDENRGDITNDEFWRHITIPAGSGPLDRPMSTIILAFERPSSQQSLQLSASASFYTRWPLDTVPGQAQKKIPTSDGPKHNSHHEKAAATARLPPSFMHDVEQAALTFGKDAWEVAADMAGAAAAARGRGGRMGRMGPRR